MMIRRLPAVAVLFAAVLTMGVGIAEAQTQTVEFLRVYPLDDPLQSGSFIGSGRTVVVLQNTGESYTAPPPAGVIGGLTYSLYDAVLVYPKAGGIRIQIGVDPSAEPLPAGTRLANASSDSREACVDENDNVVPCNSTFARDGLRVTKMEIVSPRSSSPMLFTSNATVTGDSLGVITGQQDEGGFAEAVLTTKGQKPTFATLLTDEGLEPAYRIVDIIELEYDPVTGIALYGGYLEY